VIHGLGDPGNTTSGHRVCVVGVTSYEDGLVDWRLDVRTCRSQGCLPPVGDLWRVDEL
jgi:hypothetical protein